MRAILTAVLLSLLLIGCGLKDDLYLPEPRDDRETTADERERNDEQDA
jgi:predicted small lipoprotein YifL